jgi:hypothetical protein
MEIEADARERMPVDYLRSDLDLVRHLFSVNVDSHDVPFFRLAV